MGWTTRSTALLLGTLVTGAAAAVAAPVTASAAPAAPVAPVTFSPFAGLTDGNVLYANAVQPGAPSVAAAELAQSGAGVAGGGAGLTRTDRLGVPVTTDAARTAFGHGAGLNADVLKTQTTPGQVLLTQVDATSPGSASSANGQLLPVSLAPLATGSVIPGTATAAPLSTATTCPTTGTVLSSGTSRAANADAVVVPSLGSVASLASESSTTSSTTLVAAPAGQGLASESVSRLAPISLLGGLVQVDVLTPVALRTVAGGAPGTASVAYGAVDATGAPVAPTTPVLTVTIGSQTQTLTAQDVLGGGLRIGLGVADVSIFSPAHALAGDESTSPTTAADGTAASAAADLVRVTVPGTLPAATGIAGGPLGGLLTPVLGGVASGLSALTAPVATALRTAGVTVADVRLGHLESASTVPAGGIRCTRAVTPTTPTAPTTNPLGESRKDVSAVDVAPGQTFTYDVRVPNRGTTPVTDVTVVDTPAAGLDLVSSVPAPSARSGGTLTYRLGTVQPGAIDVITLTFRIPAGTPAGTAFGNRAVISGTYAGAPVTTTTAVTGPTAASPPVGGACTLAATLFASNQQVEPGEQLAYLVDVEDVGGAPCTSVTVTDPVPAGTTFVGCQGTCTHTGTGPGSEVTWTIGTLQPGQAATVGLIVAATGQVGTVLRDTATATAAGAAPVRLATDLPRVTGTSVGNDGSPVPGFGTAALDRATGELAFTGLAAVVPVAALLLVAGGGAAWVLRRRTPTL